jgi:hypothetical protein
LLTIVLILFYAGLAALYVALDAAMGVSLHPWFGAAYGLLGALPGLLVVALRRTPLLAAALALFAALIVAAPELDTGPRKPFLRTATAVSPGMSLAEVDRRMAAFMRYPDVPGTLNADGSAAYRHTFGPGDVDAVIVRVEHGRVTSSQVLLD